MFRAGEPLFLTLRCFQGRHLMAPSPQVTQTIGGVVAKATHLYPGVQLHDIVVLSNHIHLIATPSDPSQLPRFMGWMAREISVRAGRLIGWRGAFFERRYDAAPILDEEALEGRVLYLRAHGVKEFLVNSLEEWPGLTVLPELHHGKARLFPIEMRTKNQVEWLPIRLAPLPGWEGLSTERSREQHRELTRRATREALSARGPGQPCGVEKVINQDPMTRPARVARSPRVRCFAVSKKKRLEYWATYRAFVENLRAGYEELLSFWRERALGGYCLPGFGLCPTPG
jgi:REP element-mobilizing transposase RayT